MCFKHGWRVACLGVLLIILAVLLIASGILIIVWSARTTRWLHNEGGWIFGLVNQEERLHKIRIQVYCDISIGILLCLSSCLGCVAVVQGKVLLLYLYWILIFVSLIGMFAAATYIVVSIQKFKTKLKKQMALIFKDELVEYYDSKSLVKTLLDTVQDKYKCCGAVGCEDYGERVGGPPKSCHGCNSGKVEGCSDKIFEKIAKSRHGIVIPALVLAAFTSVLEILTLVLCFLYVRNIITRPSPHEEFELSRLT